MRKEYDFSKGERGKHLGKQIRVVGDKRSNKRVIATASNQRLIKVDLKKPKRKP
jgi:hypothetical protein